MNLSAEAIALAIAAALNAQRNGAGWIARCPMPGHADKHPSFSINVRDGKLFVRCLAGCSQEAVINELRRRGLWGEGLNGARSAYADTVSSGPREIKDPMRSWLSAAPFARGSTVDVYLKGRGIDITDDEARSLRFLPALFHWPTKTKWPCMLTRVALADGANLTTHQTFLEPDGSGKAPLEKPRLFVGSGGKAKGGGIWFGVVDPAHEFIVAEGIESCLSSMRIFGVAAGCAALSEGGIRTLILPPEARRVRVFADHDELQQGLSAARDAARRWRAEGRDVKATMSEKVGEDANNVWLRRSTV